MFCQVKLTTKIRDLKKLQDKLFLFDKYDSSWLNECLMSLSPCGSLAVISRTSQVCILGPHWDSSTNSTALDVNWTGSLPSDVTDVLALPITSCGQSSKVYSDWVCVVVGYKSGEVDFFTDQGQFLKCEKLEDSPVISIKCFTSKLGTETDELCIVYSKAICRISGNSLVQLLNYARLQLAREKAGGTKENLEGNSVLSKKLAFHSYTTINDALIYGLDHTNTFDYLATSSLQEGFYTRSIRSVPPHNTVCLGIGDPFVSFHQATEGGSAQPLLTEVARAVSNRLLGWLGSIGNEYAERPLPAASDKLLPTIELSDSSRRGVWVVPSPDRHLAAIYDSFGRITIMDVRKNIIFRMFKGYRDSQCGFLEVYDVNNKRKGSGRCALFIVLYVGKRGILEVWPLRGPKIAVFTASKFGKLLYNPHGSLQLVPYKSTRSCLPSLSLIDPDGQVKELAIPFHFALNRENSERPRDVHLVKRLRQLIKEKQCDHQQLEKEVLNTVRELKTSDIKIHCIEMMAASRNVPPGILFTCIQCLQESPSSSENKEGTEKSDFTKLTTILENLGALMRLYMDINNMGGEGDAKENVTDVEKTEAEAEAEADKPELAFITEYEMNNFQHLLKHAASAQQRRAGTQKVSFVEDRKSLHSEFVTAFSLVSRERVLELKYNIDKESLNNISYELFNRFIEGDIDWKIFWGRCSLQKTIAPPVLCKLLFTYWMSKPVDQINKQKMEKFGEILYQICNIQGFSDIYVGYNDTSSWWQLIRNILVEAPCPFRSMITAQICRAVAQRIEKEVDGSEEGTWVSVSRDNAQWGLLIGKLDDISLLSIVLSQNHEPVDTLPKLSIELPEINLKFIYSSGKGSITELSAKWLCSAGVDPKDIMEEDAHTKADSDQDKSADERFRGVMGFEASTKKLQNMTRLQDHLMLLRKQFPFSLNMDSLVINMCWEYSKYWTKNIADLQYFQSMLYCLTCVSSVSLRCGIMSLIWSTHLIHSFQCAYKLISKVGKLPRETLCKQDVGLSNSQLLQYLEKVHEFFDLFLCSALWSDADKGKETTLTFEPIWEESSLALSELALANCKTNIDVLQVHHQLSAALYYQCYLGVNFWKHLTYLFDMESQKCAFTSLRAEGSTLPVHRSLESRVATQRLQFLLRLVGKSAELGPGEQRDMWIDRVQELARMWRADTDHLRRHYVFKLYAQSEDSQGKAACSFITNVSPLHGLLVPLAGRRLRRFIDDSTRKADILAVLTPATISYLETLEFEENEVYPHETLATTLTLLEDVTMHEDQEATKGVMKTGHMLLDACTTIQQHLNIGY